MFSHPKVVTTYHESYRLVFIINRRCTLKDKDTKKSTVKETDFTKRGEVEQT